MKYFRSDLLAGSCQAICAGYTHTVLILADLSLGDAEKWVGRRGRLCCQQQHLVMRQLISFRQSTVAGLVRLHGHHLLRHV